MYCGTFYTYFSESLYKDQKKSILCILIYIEREIKVTRAFAISSTGSLLLMLFSGIYISFIGKIFVAEIFFALLLLSLLLKNSHKAIVNQTQYKIVLKLLLMCQIGQIISDLIQDSAATETFKGFLLILFISINFIVITHIIQFRLNRYLVAIIFFAVSQVVSYLFQPQLFEGANAWKFGFGSPFTSIFFCWLTFNKKLNPTLIFTLSLFLSGIDLLLGCRNLAGITLLAGLLSAISRAYDNTNQLNANKFGMHSMLIRSKKQPLIRFSIMLLAISLMLLFSYQTAATNGWLGKEASEKYRLQTNTGTNLLLSSRSEVFSEYLAIRDSPIIGHGSYAKLSPELRQKLLPWLLENRLSPNLVKLDSDNNYLIPVHSGLLTFWVWYGILAIPFFIYAFSISISIIRSKNAPPILYYFAVLMCWDIFFSPFGMYARIQYPLTLIGIILFSKQKVAN